MLRGAGGDHPGFPATYPGYCRECLERIEVGSLIQSEREGYRHVVCPEAVPEKPTRFQGTSLEEMGF